MLSKTKEIFDNDIVVERYETESGINAIIKSYAVYDYLKSILESEKHGYIISSSVLCAADYGAPQKRMRFVAMGIKKQNKNSKEDIKNALIKANALNLQGRLFYSLSGGERQKVSLARCYCQNANLFLLDEPSSFLDTKSKNIFLEQMKNLENQNCSVIAVTHDEELIKNLNWKVIKWNK